MQKTHSKNFDLPLQQFNDYCHNLQLKSKSIKSLMQYANSFITFLESNKINSFSQVTYKQLVNFSITGSAGVSTVKLRIWMLKKLFSFLHLKQYINDNVSAELKPPKIPEKETDFLSKNELLTVCNMALKKINRPYGFRDFIIILLMAVTGLRKNSVVSLDKDDFDPQNNRLFISEKGNIHKRIIYIPLALSQLLSEFIYRFNIPGGPLFRGKKGQRLKADSVNKIVNGIKKLLIQNGNAFAENLHPHIFRHSAATQIFEVADITLTKEFLGHRNIQNTKKYLHLSPRFFGKYMIKHPYFTQKEF